MKKNLTICLFLGIVFLLGCQEQQSDVNAEKLEKLQAHKSYQLSVELEQAQAKINQQSEDIENLQKELQKKTKLYEECMTKEGTQFMEMIAPMLDELENTKKQNQQLRKELETLKSSQN